MSAQSIVGALPDTSFTVEIEEEMDASCSLLQSTFSEAAASQDGFTADPSTPPDLQSYDHILSVVLNDLGKSELGSFVFRRLVVRGQEPRHRVTV